MTDSGESTGESTGVPCERQWAMPHKNTFSIAPIRMWLNKLLPETKEGACSKWIDPFANHSAFLHRIWKTNDINPAMPTDCHMDALEFLRTFDSASLDGVLFDPPYSIHQINQVYEGFGNEKPIKTSTAYWMEISRILKPGGKVVYFGWNSNVPSTIGRDVTTWEKLPRGRKSDTGLRLSRVLLVAHGGGHHDTIVTLATKVRLS